MKPDIDLSKLAFDSNSSPKSLLDIPLPKRNKLTKIVIPSFLITGFLVVSLWAVRGFLIPAIDVTVTPVVTSSVGLITNKQTTNKPLFQSPGWIEPEPLPTEVSALISGVVSEILVLDGNKVERNQVVARLADQDAKLLLAEAKANLQQRRTEYEAAEKILENPIDQKEAVERSQAEARRLKAEHSELIEKLQLAKKLLDNKKRMVEIGALSANQQRQAEIDVIQIEANIAKLEAQQSINQTTIEAAQSRLTLRLTDRQRLDVARIALKEAEIQIHRAQLQLERCQIRSPIDGIVMRVMVAPGSLVSAFNEVGNTAAIMSLYSPENLQVRVDVPIAESSKIQLGMVAEVRLEALGERSFRAQVSRISGQADLQRNTLPVKVKLQEVDARLKPDMLARVQFFNSQHLENSSTTNVQTSALLFIPKETIENKDGQASVWVIDANTNLAKRRLVTLGTQTQDGLQEVINGLAIGEKVVHQNREKLTEGARVHIKGVQ
jgi:RND family efflux transporter MFP subunit